MVSGSGCYYEKKVTTPFGFSYTNKYEYCLTGCCGSKIAEEVKACCSATGAYVGIIIGIIVFIGVIVGVCFLVKRRKNSSAPPFNRM